MAAYALQNLINYEAITCASDPLTSCYRFVAFKPDGTHMYVTRRDKDGSYEDTFYIVDFSLSTPWDISTAVYSAQKLLSGVLLMEGMYLKPDGSHAFFLGYVGTDNTLLDYSFGTAWDVTSLTLVGSGALSSSFFDEGYVFPSSLQFSLDGSEFFTSWHEVSYEIISVSLSIPWDVTSTMTISQNLGNAHLGDYLMGGATEFIDDVMFQFSEDHTKIYMTSASAYLAGGIYRLDMSIVDNMSSANWPTVSTSLETTADVAGSGLFYNAASSKMYSMGMNETLYIALTEYNIGASEFWTNFEGQSEVLV